MQFEFLLTHCHGFDGASGGPYDRQVPGSRIVIEADFVQIREFYAGQ